jgi:hypothetical protein
VDVGAVVDRFDASGAEALMTVFRNDGRWDRSNVEFDGERVLRYDKQETDPAAAGMHHIDYGLSVVRAESVRARLPDRGPSDLAEMMRSISLEGGLVGFEAQHRFFEIGSPAGLAALQDHLEP